MGSRVSTDFTNTMYVKQLCLAALAAYLLTSVFCRWQEIWPFSDNNTKIL